MARVDSKILLLVAAVMAVLAASHAACAEKKQQSHAIDYMLDDSVGTIALYPGLGCRSYVDPKDVVPSLEDLERRVSQLPPGARLHWAPYKRDPSGKPILFSEGQYNRFARFCRDHKIELIVLPSQPSNTKTS
jgi:hypothetical protein